MTKFTQQTTEADFEAMFPDDAACKAYLTARRWPDGVRCPRCGNDKIAVLVARPFHWQCRSCSPTGYRFSVLVGTIFENTNVSLRVWFKIILLMLASKKGIAALQVQRMFGFGSYETAHYMCRRIRGGLVDPEFRKLLGIVEVDDTYIGGKSRNRHADKRTGGRGEVGNGIVAGAVSRDGTVVARVIRNTDAKMLHNFVSEAVSTKVTFLATDERPSYEGL